MTSVHDSTLRLLGLLWLGGGTPPEEHGGVQTPLGRNARVAPAPSGGIPAGLASFYPGCRQRVRRLSPKRHGPPIEPSRVGGVEDRLLECRKLDDAAA